MNPIFKSNNFSARQTFFIGTAVSLLSMILPWLTGYRVSYLAGTVDTSLNGFQCGAWVPFLISLALPVGFFVTKSSMPRWLKIIALFVTLSVIVSEANQAVREGSVVAEPHFLEAGGIGQWFFILAQIACFMGILRFPHSPGAVVKTNPPPLPPSPAP